MHDVSAPSGNAAAQFAVTFRLVGYFFPKAFSSSVFLS